MPCNLNTICYIDQYNETARKSSFVVNAVGIVNSRHQNINIYVHIIAFYPKDITRDNDLERFSKGDIIQVQGKFSIIETEVDDNKIRIIKMLASSICMLDLDEEDLPRTPLSVVLTGVTSDNPDIGSDKITLGLNAREYLDNQNNNSLSFELYHFPEDAHLLPISSKITRGSSLYVTGYLSIIEDHLLIRITQLNFIESAQSSPHKSSGYAWEKKQTGDSSIQQSPTEISKSLSTKSKKRGKHKTSVLSRPQKVPKLSSLSLPQLTDQDEDSQTETSLQLNTDNTFQEETLTDDIVEVQPEKNQEQRKNKGRGRKKK